MGSKVIHVSDELHARLREFCSHPGRGTRMNVFVEEVLRHELDRLEKEEREEPVTPVTVPVEKKTKSPEQGDQTGERPEPWSQPPFWKNAQN